MAFPASKYDHQVDALSQALDRAFSRRGQVTTEIRGWLLLGLCSQQPKAGSFPTGLRAEESVHACHDMTATASVIALAWPLAGLWAVEAPASGRRTTMEAIMSKTQPTTAKLSDAQLVILSAAAQRADGSLLPFPQSLTAKGAALNKVVETLCKRKLVEERKDHQWRA